MSLLILWLGYGEREAAGTSLAAIAVIAAIATLVQGACGLLKFSFAALMLLVAAQFLRRWHRTGRPGTK